MRCGRISAPANQGFVGCSTGAAATDRQSCCALFCRFMSERVLRHFDFIHVCACDQTDLLRREVFGEKIIDNNSAAFLKLPELPLLLLNLLILLLNLLILLPELLILLPELLALLLNLLALLLNLLSLLLK